MRIRWSRLRERFSFRKEGMRGAFKGSSGQVGPEQTFLATPSPLLLLLFKFVAVSIGVSTDFGAGELCFLLFSSFLTKEDAP